MEVTREQLYEWVWQWPLTQLADKHETTYAELVKACEAMQVPRPERGHWRRARVGARSPRPPLPEHGTERWALRQRKASGTATAPASAASEHPLIAATRKALKDARADNKGTLAVSRNRRHLSIEVTRTGVNQALKLYSQMITEVLGVGGRVETHCPEYGPRQTLFIVDGESFRVAVRERRAVTRRELTARERAGIGWLRAGSDGLVPEYAPTGRFVVKVFGEGRRQARMTLEATKTKSLEVRLRGFGQLLTRLAAGRVDTRERQAAAAVVAEQRRKEEAARLQERLRRERMVKKTLELVERRRHAGELRAFLREAEHLYPAGHRPDVVAEWMRVIGAEANAMDPLASRSRLEELLQRPY